MTTDFTRKNVLFGILAAFALFIQGCAVVSSTEEYAWDVDGLTQDESQAQAAPETAQQEATIAAQPSENVAAKQAEIEKKGAKIVEEESGGGNFEIDENKAAEKRKFEPTLSPGYRIRVVVMIGDNTEVGPVEVMVSEKNDVMLPLVGRVDCGGMTVNAMRSTLTDGYAEFFADPEVSVAFIYSDDGISPYGQVLVQGRVKKEGWVNIPPTRNLRLTHAIQRSGGFASSALRSNVRVTRQLEDGTTAVFKVNFKEIGKKGALDKDIILEPFDVVYVDESNF